MSINAHFKQSAYFDKFCLACVDGEIPGCIKSPTDNTSAVSYCRKEQDEGFVVDVVVGGGVHLGPPRLLRVLRGVQGEVRQGVRVRWGGGDLLTSFIPSAAFIPQKTKTKRKKRQRPRQRQRQSTSPMRRMWSFDELIPSNVFMPQNHRSGIWSSNVDFIKEHNQQVRKKWCKITVNKK